MSVSVLNNLGAMSAAAAAAPITGGLNSVQSSSSAGIFSLLFNQQLGENAANNPLLTSLIAENPSAAPQFIKNALHLNNDNDNANSLDLNALFAMLTPDANAVLAQITPDVENRNDLALSTLNNLIANNGGSSNNASNALFNALMAQANKTANGASESVKLAANDESIDTPFNHILAAVESAQTKNTTPNVSVSSPVGSVNWGAEFNQQIVWAAKNDVQSAEIRLHPENLGPIKISLNIADGKAQIAFVAAHSEVRQSIQEALPQLKEMLAASGIDLGQTNVGSEEKSPNFQDFSAQAQKQSGILTDEPTFEEAALMVHLPENHAPMRVLKADSAQVDLFA